MANGLSTETLRPHIADAKHFPIFLSSADEALTLRDRVQRAVEETLNAQLSHRGWPVHFPVWRWEEVSAGAAAAGQSTNDRFVQMARESSVTIVLLRDHLRRGTREELLAVKDDDDVELTVLWFPRRPRLPFLESQVARFLSQHEDDIGYNRFPNINGEEAWLGLFRNLVATLLRALRSEQRTPYVERR